VIGGIVINEFMKNDTIIIPKKENTTHSERKNEEEKTNSWSIIDKMTGLKNKFAVKWLIIEGEAYMENEQYALALKNFLQVFKNTNEDQVIAEKIGDIYMEMNKYSPAYKYYKKAIWEISPELKDKIIMSYLYNAELKDEGKREDAKKEILSLNFSEEKKFYYLTVLECLDDFHTCKTNFSTYIYDEKKELETEELKNMKIAFDNYRNFQLEDIYYKNALIIWALFKDKMYPVSVLLGKDILKEKENYKPILKIIAQSYFEIGNMQWAKIYLGLYNKIEPNDKDVIYMMGIINLKLHEYILSNIFLNRALELEYKPSINVKRRLIYNYFELGQIEKMLKEFENLAKNEETIEKEDIYLAIYYHIIYNKKDIALELAKLWLTKFPSDGNMYGYIGWIYKDNNDLVKTREILEQWLKIDPQNALINLNMWYLEIAKWDEKKSIIYFKKTIKKDKEGEFWRQAQKEVNTISQK
jgi:hypothetical protein